MTVYEACNRNTFRFNPDIKVTVLAALLLPCLLSLGIWQLSRAEEKEILKQVFEQRRTQSPISFADIKSNEDLRFVRVNLQGKYDPNVVILLDNKMRQGQFGYEIVSLFHVNNSSEKVLVNRGWIAGDRSRRTFPSIQTPLEAVSITAEIYVPQRKMMTLSTELVSDAWPRVLPSIEVESVKKELNKKIFPYTVRIDHDSAGAYKNNWVVVNVQPKKHIAYAFQWFAMAATVLVIVILANTNLWALIKGRHKNDIER